MKVLCRLRVAVIIGIVRASREVSIAGASKFITFIWSCTNFLTPKANG